MISIFKNIKETIPFANLPIFEIFEIIKIGTLQKVDDLVNIVKNKEKLKAPYFTPTGTFFAKRNNSGLQNYSGLIHIDIDKKHNSHLLNLCEDGNFAASIKSALSEDKFTFAAFVSVGGEGVCLFYRTENGAEKYSETLVAASKYLKSKFDINFDSAVSSISEARYFSYDPQIYINEKSTFFNSMEIIEIKKNTTLNPKNIIHPKGDFEKQLAKVVSSKVDLTVGYQKWLNLGFAIASEFGEGGRDYFHQISQFNDLYNYENCDKQYTNCLKSDNKSRNPVTISTFFSACKDAGILVKSGSRAKQPQPQTQPEKAVKNQSESDKIAEFLINQGLYFDVISRCFFCGKKVITDTERNDLYILSINSICDGNRKKLPRAFFDTIFNSSAIPQVNELQIFLELLPAAEGTKTIDRFISAITISDAYGEIAKDFVKRWLVSIIANMYAMQTFEQGEDFEVSPLLLMLCEPRGGTGKSEFFKRLLPNSLRRFFYKTQLDDPNIKDEYIKMTSNILCLVDEIDLVLQNEKKANFLKFVTANDIFDIRAPYKSSSEKRPKLAVFGATSNPSDILLKSEGNRRIIPVKITGAIDWKLQNSIDRIQLFAELHNLYTQGFQWRIVGDDITRLELLSSGFVSTNYAVEMLELNYEEDSTLSPKTLTEIILGLPYKIHIDNAQIAKFAAAIMNLNWRKDGRKGYRVRKI